MNTIKSAPYPLTAVGAYLAFNDYWVALFNSVEFKIIFYTIIIWSVNILTKIKEQSSPHILTTIEQA